MTLLRGQFLTTGPLALIAVCYFIAAPSVPASRVEQFFAPNFSGKSHLLATECRTVADQLQQQLSRDWNIVIHEPFVIAGDCPAAHLDRCYQDTIAPTARALSVQYFDQQPTWPISIVLCTTDESYRECHLQLGDKDRSEYSGIYLRSQHRIVVNIATGEGTLAHELTHALAHADFPEMPEWLDEGLASLYEECEFSPDELRLVGLENWRGAVLRGAMKAETLRSISEMTEASFAKTDPPVEYAQARYFCLYLQKRNLLEPFYRKCRSHAKTSRNGLEPLQELIGMDEAAIDQAFQTWMMRGDVKR
ncbi:MAG: hypothetical protein WCJ09_15805 [Planctomycetota bacterium]